MTERVHRIIDVDTPNKRAICTHCGPVDVYKKKNSWVCLPGKRRGVQESRQRKKYGRVLDDRPKECSVCGSPDRVCYDHDHATEEFRGWLCNGCNLALGHTRDNPEILRKLADYIEKKL